MESLNYSASIEMREIKRTFTCNSIPMLTLSILYPKVTLRHYPYAQDSINLQIQAQVCDFLHYASSDLYQQAVVNYKQSQENEFPFRLFEAVLNYEITYNQNCHLSLYRDQYTFTGGAHGSTVRSSNTWNLMSGCNIPLSDFFAGQEHRASLIEQITKQAGENPEIYFEDYPALIEKSFNEEHYYLTPSGIAIYYQQYEIAPYSTGIVVFTIPYVDDPSCSKSPQC